MPFLILNTTENRVVDSITRQAGYFLSQVDWVTVPAASLLYLSHPMVPRECSSFLLVDGVYYLRTGKKTKER